MMRMARAIGFAAVLVAMATPAAADDPERPRVSATLGVGVATPFHGDLDFRAGAWQASLRAAVAPHMLIEGFFGEWRHMTSRVTTDTIVQGPGGVLGRVDRVTQRTEYVRPALGFNLLAAGSAGRVTWSAGGGPGLLLYRRHFTQTLEGCQGVELPCDDTDNRFSSSAFSVQAAAALDVAVAPRLGAFAEFRVAVPVRDVGSGQSAVVAGARVTIW